MSILSRHRHRSHDEISRLLARANECLELKDWEGYANLFVPHGVLVTPSGSVARGHAQLRRLLHAQVREALRCFNVHVNVAVEGDHAQASSYQIVLEHTREPSVLGAGFCADALVRNRDGWRFESRRFFGDVLDVAVERQPS
jgi:uncharacterized protein (TIGR02246 family)